MKTVKKTLLLPVALALLSLPAGAEAKKGPKLQSFAGTCELSGARQIDDAFFLSRGERSSLVGTCYGRVNGRDRPYTWTARMRTTGRMPIINLTARGTGFLKLRGLRGRLHFRYERTADRIVELSGKRSRAWAIAGESLGRYRAQLVTDGDLRGL